MNLIAIRPSWGNGWKEDSKSELISAVHAVQQSFVSDDCVESRLAIREKEKGKKRKEDGQYKIT